MKRCVFCHLFQQELGEFAASIERSEAKSVSASGGLHSPDPPTRDFALDPAGSSALDPRYRLALCALAMAPFAKF